MKKNIKKIIYIESKPSFLDQHSIINEDLLKLNNEFYYLKKKKSLVQALYTMYWITQISTDYCQCWTKNK